MTHMIALYFPTLAFDRLARLCPGERKHPGVLLSDVRGQRRVMAVNDPAAALGLAPGLSLAEARALCPDLRATMEAPASDLRLLRALLRWANRYSPRLSRDGLEGLLIDSTGVAHLFGGEKAMLADMALHLSRWGIQARLALAPNASAARALARYGESGVIVEPEELGHKLDPLPTAALEPGDGEREACHRLGVTRLGKLRALPRAALLRRLGSHLLERLDRLYGQVPDPVNFVPHRQRWQERLNFTEPLRDQASLDRAVRQLLERLCYRLSKSQKAVRRLTLTLEQVDGDRLSLPLGTTRPLREAGVLFALLRLRLENLDIGEGIDALWLGVDELTPFGAEQEVLSGRRHGDTRALSDLLDTLVSRLGEAQVRCFDPAASHCPERAFISRPATTGPPSEESWLPRHLPRPLLLYPSPRPLLAPLPANEAGAPPHRLYFQGRSLALRPIAGPERIEPEWWRHDPHWKSGGRSYWWVRSEAADDLWIYHADGDQNWHLHGIGL